MSKKTAVAALLLLVACGETKAPPIHGDYAAAKITDRVYVIHGPLGMPSQENQGFANNPAFVLTSAGVVVIDPGSSVQVGEMVLDKIAAVTGAPVIAVFNTHIHGDHWLGNQAIKHAFPKAVIYAHPKMIEQARAGAGAGWVNILDTMTAGATRGTVARPPDLGVGAGETLKLHNLRFRIYHNDRAHTDTDIMIEVVEEGVLFLGDNGLNRVLRRMDDGNLKGQLAALDAALASKARHFVPGHGQSGGRAIVVGYRNFLTALRAAVKKYHDRGLGDYEMKDQVIRELAAYKDWKNFNDVIGRTIGVVYLQIESEAF